MFVRAAQGGSFGEPTRRDRTEKGTIASAPLGNLPGAVEAGVIQQGISTFFIFTPIFADDTLLYVPALGDLMYLQK